MYMTDQLTVQWKLLPSEKLATLSYQLSFFVIINRMRDGHEIALFDFGWSVMLPDRIIRQTDKLHNIWLLFPFKLEGQIWNQKSTEEFRKSSQRINSFSVTQWQLIHNASDYGAGILFIVDCCQKMDQGRCTKIDAPNGTHVSWLVLRCWPSPWREWEVSVRICKPRRSDYKLW